MKQKNAFSPRFTGQKFIYTALLAGIFIIFFITRLWKLAYLPWGIHIDEAGMAYDAWCLSQYGVDRYLKSWPVYLTNFGGGQSSLYAFLCAFLFKCFGYSLYLARIPAVLFSFLNLIFGMKLVQKIYPEKPYLSIAAGGLITICPYFIMSGRFALDCNLMLGMSTVFLYCILTAAETGQLRYYFLAGLTGGLVLYTYALTYIILPLFLVFLLLYLIRTQKFSLQGWIAMAIPLSILAFPLILVQLVNIFNLDEFQLGCFTITKLQFYRAGEVGRFRFPLLLQAWNSIFAGDSLAYNSAPAYSPLYGITAVLFILGLIAGIRKLIISIKKKSADFIAIPLLWFSSVFFLEVHIDSNTNKINGIFCCVIILAIAGLDLLARLNKKIFIAKRNKENPRAALYQLISFCLPVVILCSYILYFISFSSYYFGSTYTADTYLLPYFHIPFPEAAEFLEQDNILCQKETQVAEPKIVYAISSLLSPYILMMWKEYDDTERFDSYHFNCLGEISDQCNYIVRDGFDNYCSELRASGFTEIRFTGYSLFYKK